VVNFCFQAKETNLIISDRLPEEYFPFVENEHPGSLSSEWIPMDPELWKIENYREFLEARKNLRAEEANKQLVDLLHGETTWLESPVAKPAPLQINVGITTKRKNYSLTSSTFGWNNKVFPQESWHLTSLILRVVTKKLFVIWLGQTESRKS